MQFCYACHGEKGDGNGPAARRHAPPAARLHRGQVQVPGRGRGRAAQRRGPAGPAAQRAGRHLDAPLGPQRAGAGWPSSPYLKTFSPRWQNETPGEPVQPRRPRPLAGPGGGGLRAGREDLPPVRGRDGPRHPAAPDRAGRMHRLPPQLPAGPGAERAVPVGPGQAGPGARAPDAGPSSRRATTGRARPSSASCPPTSCSTALKNGVIAAGDSSAPSPPASTAPPCPPGRAPSRIPDLWALAHYVRRLAQLRDTPAGAALRARLDAASPR